MALVDAPSGGRPVESAPVGRQDGGPMPTRELLSEIHRARLLVIPEARLRRPPGPPSPKNFKDALGRLNFVRSLGLAQNVGAGVHHNRLSREGAKTTPQHLKRFDPLRRRATLVAYLSERGAEHHVCGDAGAGTGPPTTRLDHG